MLVGSWSALGWDGKRMADGVARDELPCFGGILLAAPAHGFPLALAIGLVPSQKNFLGIMPFPSSSVI